MNSEVDVDMSSLIDTTALENLRSIMEDEFLEVLQLYLEESVTLMSDIHAGFSENTDSLPRTVHTLKSSSKNVGAKSLGDITEEMETLLKAEDFDSAKKHLDELQDVFTKTHAFIKQYTKDNEHVMDL